MVKIKDWEPEVGYQKALKSEIMKFPGKCIKLEENHPEWGKIDALHKNIVYIHLHVFSVILW